MPLPRRGSYFTNGGVRGSSTQTWNLRLVRKDAQFLARIEVRPNGNEIIPSGADERLRLIAQGAIVRRAPLQMNLHYGELEPLTTPTTDPASPKE